jgi:hypothetical protein
VRELAGFGEPALALVGDKSLFNEKEKFKEKDFSLKAYTSCQKGNRSFKGKSSPEEKKNF